jgi:hypothetical protein
MFRDVLVQYSESASAVGIGVRPGLVGYDFVVFSADWTGSMFCFSEMACCRQPRFLLCKLEPGLEVDTSRCQQHRVLTLKPAGLQKKATSMVLLGPLFRVIRVPAPVAAVLSILRPGFFEARVPPGMKAGTTFKVVCADNPLSVTVPQNIPATRIVCFAKPASA